jgi:hypothetical protein
MKKVILTLFIILIVFFFFSCTKKITEPQIAKKVWVSVSGKITLQNPDYDNPFGPSFDFPKDYSSTQVDIYSVSMFAKDTVKECIAFTDSLGNFSAFFELGIERRILIRPQREEYLFWPPYPNEIWLGIAENSTGFPYSKGGCFNVLCDTMVSFQVSQDTVKFKVKDLVLDNYLVHFGLLKGSCFVRKNIIFEWATYDFISLSLWPYPESTAYISATLEGQDQPYMIVKSSLDSLSSYKLWLLPGKNKIRCTSSFTYYLHWAFLDDPYELHDSVFTFNVLPGYWLEMDFYIGFWFWLDRAWMSLKDSLLVNLTYDEIVHLADSLAENWGCDLIEVQKPYSTYEFKLDLPEGVGTKRMIEILKSKPEVKDAWPD